MDKVILNSLRVNNTTSELEGFFRVDNTTAEQIRHSQEIIIMVKEFAERQKAFSEEKYKVSYTSALFSKILPFEIEKGKDLVHFSYNEIIDLIIKLAAQKTWNTKANYTKSLVIIRAYTEWGYNKELRNDIVTVEDIGQKLPYEEVIDKGSLSGVVLIPSEIEMFYNLLEVKSTKLVLKLVTEGLDISEIIELRIEHFYDNENHPIDLPSRKIILSDEVYNLCKEHSRENYVVTALSNSNNTDYERRRQYADTGYLIRPFKSDRAKPVPVDQMFLTTKTKTHLQDAGCFATIRDIRTSCMLYDIYKNNFTVEQINNKYGTNYEHSSYITSKKKSEIEVLRDKIVQEKEEAINNIK